MPTNFATLHLGESFVKSFRVYFSADRRRVSALLSHTHTTHLTLPSAQRSLCHIHHPSLPLPRSTLQRSPPVSYVCICKQPITTRLHTLHPTALGITTCHPVSTSFPTPQYPPPPCTHNPTAPCRPQPPPLTTIRSLSKAPPPWSPNSSPTASILCSTNAVSTLQKPFPASPNMVSP